MPLHVSFHAAANSLEYLKNVIEDCTPISKNRTLAEFLLPFLQQLRVVLSYDDDH
jgi:hypothetical protein